jgi:hypothetical protein
MYHLVYVSSAVNLFSDAQLGSLLEVSRRNNSSCGVTGLLLYIGGNFIQVLEGDQEIVLATHLRIANDPRHRGMITLLQGECEHRDFDEWSMGFKKVEAGDVETTAGYSDFLRQGVDASARRSAALRLLENFKAINR